MKNTIIKHFFIKLIIVVLAMIGFGFLTMPGDCKQCIILIPVGSVFYSLPILCVNALQFLILFKRTYNSIFILINFVLTILPSFMICVSFLCVSDLNSSDSKISLVGVFANLVLNTLSFVYVNKFAKVSALKA